MAGSGKAVDSRANKGRVRCLWTAMGCSPRLGSRAVAAMEQAPRQPVQRLHQGRVLVVVAPKTVDHVARESLPWFACAHGISERFEPAPVALASAKVLRLVPGQALAAFHSQHPAAGCQRQAVAAPSTAVPSGGAFSVQLRPSTARLRRKAESARVGSSTVISKRTLCDCPRQRDVSNLRTVQPVKLPASMRPSSRP